MSVGEVDLLVSVPTHNSAQTVGETVQRIRMGLLKYFPRERAGILNADAGSKDGSTSDGADGSKADGAGHPQG